MKVIVQLFNLLILLSFLSCDLPLLASAVKESPKNSYSSTFNLIKPGDIVVSNSTSDSVVLLDENGNYKKTLLDLDNTIDSPYGIDFNPVTKEIVVIINGTPDRVMGISIVDGSTRLIINHAQLTGNTYDLAVTAAGDYLITETSALEKFTGSNGRITTGGFPVATLQTNLSHISSTSTGGFVACSTGSDVIRTYTSAAVQINTASSGIGGTTDAYGCIQLANGGFAVAWNGTTDTIRFYNSALTATGINYSDTGILGNPRGIAERANGNLLILDATFSHIVEIDSAGNFVGIIGGDVLNVPYEIIVVPDYTP